MHFHICISCFSIFVVYYMYIRNKNNKQKNNWQQNYFFKEMKKKRKPEEIKCRPAWFFLLIVDNFNHKIDYLFTEFFREPEREKDSMILCTDMMFSTQNWRQKSNVYVCVFMRVLLLLFIYILHCCVTLVMNNHCND